MRLSQSDRAARREIRECNLPHNSLILSFLYGEAQVPKSSGSSIIMSLTMFRCVALPPPHFPDAASKTSGT